MIKCEIKFVKGSVAPRYPNGTELQLDHVSITENGMESGLPMVDIVMRGPGDELFLFVTTGRIINAISAAVKGVNVRCHGKEEP